MHLGDVSHWRMICISSCYPKGRLLFAIWLFRQDWYLPHRSPYWMSWMRDGETRSHWYCDLKVLIARSSSRSGHTKTAACRPQHVVSRVLLG